MSRTRKVKTTDPALLAKRSAAAKKGAATRKAKLNGNGNTATAVATPPATPVKKLMQNRFAILLDKSGSMNNIQRDAVDAFNNQIQAIKNAKDQESEVSLYYFGDSSISEVLKKVPVSKLKTLDYSSYRPSGGTPLYDAVAHAMEQLEDQDAETSKIVLVLTDGEDTTSRLKEAGLKKLIQQKQRTDQWTFAFMVPRDQASLLQSLLQIPAGNIQPWDDIKVADQAATGGLNRYFEARRTGAKSVTDFFKTDLSNLKKSDLKKNLKNVAADLKIWNVEKGEVEIRDFVVDKQGKYTKNHAFYQLTKPEDVQNYKKILIMEKDKPEVYGPDARALIGLTTLEKKKRVIPGNHANYDIFVQSSSFNRKLVRGTKVLYFKDEIDVDNL